MKTVPSHLEKAYPARGPLQQHRFKKATSFTCLRCGEAKKAKLIAVYAGDWSRRLCNGCHGYLLSVYEIKAGAAESDEKAMALADLLLAAVAQREHEEVRQRYLLSERRAEVLSDVAVRFLSTAEHVSGALNKKPSLDWSPAVIGLCKAAEFEIVGRLLGPLTRFRDPGLPADELGDRDIGKIAKYCAAAGVKPPELGTFAHFLQTVIHSEARRRTSQLMGEFVDQMKDWPHAGWLLDPDGLHAALVSLINGFRNRAAHTAELSAEDYDHCRSLVVGDDGLLWRLIRATEPRS